MNKLTQSWSAPPSGSFGLHKVTSSLSALCPFTQRKYPSFCLSLSPTQYWACSKRSARKIFLQKETGNAKSNLLLYPLYFAEACNKLAGPKSVSLRMRTTQLLLKKCRIGGEPLSTLCLISPDRNLKLRLPAPETGALTITMKACEL